MVCKDIVSNDLALTERRRLEAVEPGAAAHMSLHLNRQCQRAHSTFEADTEGSPIFGTGGLGVLLCWRPIAAKPCGLTASVKRHIWVGPQTVKHFLQFYFERRFISTQLIEYTLFL